MQVLYANKLKFVSNGEVVNQYYDLNTPSGATMVHDICSHLRGPSTGLVDIAVLINRTRGITNYLFPVRTAPKTPIYPTYVEIVGIGTCSR